MREISLLKIVAGVSLGILVAWLVRSWIVRYEEEQALQAFQQQLLRIQQTTQAEMQGRQRVQAEMLTREHQVVQDAQQKQLQIKQEAQLQQDANARLVRDKAIAWDAYYKPSKSCNTDPSTIECGNEHARAKLAFDSLWARQHP